MTKIADPSKYRATLALIMLDVERAEWDQVRGTWLTHSLISDDAERQAAFVYQIAAARVEAALATRIGLCGIPIEAADELARGR